MRRLHALRATIRAIERGGLEPTCGGIPTGHPVLDGSLPRGGLPAPAVHEVSGAAADGFAAAFASRIIASGAPLLVWCADEARAKRCGSLHGPGFARFGIGPERLLLVACRGAEEVLAACEEALRAPAGLVVVAELDHLDLGPGRRLQLAAEAGGSVGFCLVARIRGPNPAFCRFRVEPGIRDGRRCWRVDLWRVRGGTPCEAEIVWDDEALAFAPLSGLSRPETASERAIS